MSLYQDGAETLSGEKQVCSVPVHVLADELQAAAFMIRIAEAYAKGQVLEDGLYALRDAELTTLGVPFKPKAKMGAGGVEWGSRDGGMKEILVASE